MSVRYNIANNSGVQTISGGNMPTDNYANKYQPTSRTVGQGGAGAAASITVTSNGHAVEVDGDGGMWDTVSGAIVDSNLTNAGCIGT